MKALNAILLAIIAFCANAAPAPESGGRCVDLFAVLGGGKAAGSAVERLHNDFPTLGISKTRAGYLVASSSRSTSVGTFPELIAVLSRSLEGTHQTDAPLQLYFQGLDRRDAWNIVDSLRIKSGADGRGVEGVALAGGGGDASKPPTAETSTGDDGDRKGPSHHQKTSNGGAGRNFWLAAPFKGLSKRYNWNRAEVTEEGVPTAEARLSDDFDESGYRFGIRVPPSEDEPEARFSVAVFFQRLMQRPRPLASDVAASIRSEVRKESLQRATVQRAARRIIDRVESDFNGAKARADVSDLMIVELDKRGRDRTRG